MHRFVLASDGTGFFLFVVQCGVVYREAEGTNEWVEFCKCSRFICSDQNVAGSSLSFQRKRRRLGHV